MYLWEQGLHIRKPNLCCHLETLRRAASLAMTERTALWADIFKQLHPHVLYLIGVRANIVEPKNVVISEENHPRLCYIVYKDKF